MSKALKYMAEKYLDVQMYTNEFSGMLGKAVYDDPEVKQENEQYKEMLENLKLDLETLDPILCSVNAMMARTMKIAYMKGFMDAIGCE